VDARKFIKLIYQNSWHTRKLIFLVIFSKAFLQCFI